MLQVYVTQGFMLVLLVSGIPLLASTLTGLFVALLQAATQVQEQTITYLARFVSVSAILYLCTDWFTSELVRFFESTLSTLQYLGK